MDAKKRRLLCDLAGTKGATQSALAAVLAKLPLGDTGISRRSIKRAVDHEVFAKTVLTRTLPLAYWWLEPEDPRVSEAKFSFEKIAERPKHLSKFITYRSSLDFNEDTIKIWPNPGVDTKRAPCVISDRRAC